MSRLAWRKSQDITVGPYKIPCVEGLAKWSDQQYGIRYDSKAKRIIKSFLWPAYSLYTELLTVGFITRTIGNWIRESVDKETVFLEIGCGSMKLRRFLPQAICYNAFDVSFSEFHLRRVIRNQGNINVGLATATEIPFESESVNLIASCEVFEHILEINRVMQEIYRVVKPGAKMLCSIPNNYCYKYQKKGPHSEHVNNWSYEEFIDFVKTHGFKLLKGMMKGYWIPLPTWLAKTSYQLPLSPKKEFYCTNFFYQFKVDK